MREELKVKFIQLEIPDEEKDKILSDIFDYLFNEVESEQKIEADKTN